MSAAATLADALAQRVDELVPELLSEAVRKGNYWSVGSTTNEAGDSLYIHRTGAKAGRWSDPAADQFGDMLDLVNEKVCGGHDIPQAMRWARSWLGLDTEPLTASERRPRQIPPAQSAEDKAAIGAARAIWCKTREIAGTIGEKYFRHRGITIGLPETLRFNPALFHHLSGLTLPAIVAAISGPDHKVTAVQCIFVRPDGGGKADVADPKITRGRMLNGAVRLGPDGPTLGIAEGVETALSAMQIHSAPVWAACGSRLDAIAIPDHVKWLAIFGDNGDPGVKAAERAAVKLAREGRTIKFVYPSGGYKDWNDALRPREVAA
jgi:hypothetical protein